MAASERGEAPRLYLITDRRATGGRPLGDVVARALRGAAPWRGADGRLPVAVSLREKDLGGAELVALARALSAITRAAGAALYVNERLDVALACDADGVHLPSEGLRPQDVRAVTGRLRVAVSTHTRAEVEAAQRAGAGFVVFGPIFETPSKQGLLEPRGLAPLSEVARLGVPVLALGGITPDRARTCLRAGAAGVACIRAVLGAADSMTATASFLSRI